MAENAHRFFYALSRHFLDGLSGLSPVFQTFYIQVWNKYDTLVPHPAYIYFIKMPANPDNPSRFVFFPPWRAVFLVFQNALVFKSKRTCVSSQTSLRFKSNALAFQVKRTCVFLPADLFKNSKWFSVGFICMGCSLRGPHFKYNNL